MKMSRLQHKYCIGLLLDISTTANNTAATQKCKDVLNDTTAYNPNLYSKFEMSINKFIFVPYYKIKLSLFLQIG